MANANSQRFSTKDRDQDTWPNSCATTYKGGWWYNSCHSANLNGLYHNGPHTTYADGVNWNHWKGYHTSLTHSDHHFDKEIKILHQIRLIVHCLISTYTLVKD